MPNPADRNYREKTPTSERLHQRARTVFPSGVSHNIRWIDPYPLYMTRAEGTSIWDEDGNEYVDFWMNHIACVLGHSYPSVVEAVTEQASNGLHFGSVNRTALELGERVIEMIPSAEKIRFCVSGTEATMYAVRLARASTGNDHILKAQGGWHGGNSELAMAVHAPFDIPETAGLPPETSSYVHGFPVNDEEAVERLLRKHRGNVAAVIIEPILLAAGLVSVEPSFLSFLKAASQRHEFELVFDEVVTGFRVSPGSYQEWVGVTPDLTTLGKALGGGLPVGAIAGRADLFEATEPDTPPTSAVLAGGGTFSMNPMTAVAGLASLDVIENEPVYERTEKLGAAIREGLQQAFVDAGVHAEVLGTSSLFIPHFEPEAPLTDAEAVETMTNRAALTEFHTRLFSHGYYFLPGHAGAVSYQTNQEQVDGLLKACRRVATEMVSDEVL